MKMLIRLTRKPNDKVVPGCCARLLNNVIVHLSLAKAGSSPVGSPDVSAARVDPDKAER